MTEEHLDGWFWWYDDGWKPVFLPMLVVGVGLFVLIGVTTLVG